MSSFPNKWNTILLQKLTLNNFYYMLRGKALFCLEELCKDFTIRKYFNLKKTVNKRN